MSAAAVPEYRPTNAPWISSYMTVKDVDKAIEFYQKAFHFQVRDKVQGEDGTTWHAELTYKDQLVMLGKEGVWGTTSKSPVSNGVESPVSLYVYTENVDDFYRHALSHHAVGLAAPEDMFWGDRMCKLKDLDGYVWCFATNAGGHK